MIYGSIGNSPRDAISFCYNIIGVPMAVYRCICNKVVPERQRLCLSCKDEYGQQECWPDWLVFLVSEKRKYYYYLMKVEPRLLSFNEELDSNDNLLPGKPLVTRDRKEMYFSERDALPYTSYTNKQDNIAYRRANRIPERD